MPFITKRLPLFLFLLGFSLYLFVLDGPFLWDDQQFIVENTYVHSLRNLPKYFTSSTTAGAGLESNYYRPLSTLSFAVDYAIWGMNPAGFRITNAVLHALAGVLVYLFLKELCLLIASNMSNRFPATVAFLTSAAFLVHPVAVEAVAYINSRADSLGALFVLLSMLTLLKLRRPVSDNTFLVVSFLSGFFYLLAILSKENSALAILPALWILWSIYKQTGRKSHFFLHGTLLMLIFTVYFGLRFTVLNFQSSEQLGWPESYMRSVVVRLATFTVHAVPDYLQVLLLPINLHMERAVPIVDAVTKIHWPSAMVVILGSAAMLATGFYLKRNRSAGLPLYLFGLFWTISFLFPFTGVIPVNGLLYEHWLYLPMIGFWFSIFSVVLGAFALKRRQVRMLTYSALAFVLTAWSALTIRQLRIWADPVRFYTYTLRYANTARLRNNLAMVYAEQHQYDRAEQQYNLALELNASYPQIHHNLGNLYAETGRVQEARRAYQQALSIVPTFFQSINQLIQLELAQNSTASAVRWIEYGLERFPESRYYLQLKQKYTHSRNL